MDYATGYYLGAIHERCHQNRKRNFRIPIFFHNFRGYDAHLIVQALHINKDARLNIIGQGMEKYLMVEWSHHLIFKDSLQFLGLSLEKLAENLAAAGLQHFSRLRQEFPDEKKFKLLIRKGVYPYDWMSDREKMNEKELPPRDAFYNGLRQEECTVQDYNHAVQVYNTFECSNFLDYHNLYLKSMYLLIFV